MKSEQRPSIGRIVIFTPPLSSSDNAKVAAPGEVPERYNGADKVPAIIVRTWEETSYQNDEVNLKCFIDGQGETWRTSVPYDENCAPGTWSWPPRN